MPQKKITNSSMGITSPYNTKFYNRRASWRADYDVIAEWVGKNIPGKLFGDIGCGNGYMLARLESLGKKIWGVDAAEDVEQFVDMKIRNLIRKADVSHAQKLPISDVVICTDLADRVDMKSADTLIKNIVNTNADTIIFTASQPGQAGIHHLNLQTKDYWLDKFDKHKYCLDAVLTKKFQIELTKKIKNLTWYPEDIMILQKYDSQRMAHAYTVAGIVVEDLRLEVEDLKNKNTKLTDELWAVTQQLNAIQGSIRWTATSKLIRFIKR